MSKDISRSFLPSIPNGNKHHGRKVMRFSALMTVGQTNGRDILNPYAGLDSGALLANVAVTIKDGIMYAQMFDSYPYIYVLGEAFQTDAPTLTVASKGYAPGEEPTYWNTKDEYPFRWDGITPFTAID